ncbi:MAG TPA: hypothetical protein VI791_00560, partial [Patescibacteria group bacterium]|nr:hypothetical protein [Patescibacteria group bacterium]
PALLTAFVASRQGRVQTQYRLQAVAYLTEASEAVRSVREKGWTTFAVNGIYHPVANASDWSLALDPDTPAPGLTRSIEIADAHRNASGALDETSTTVDPSTKRITITVSWSAPYSSNVSSVFYLTRYLDNLAYVETTIEDFNAGITTNTAVQATGGSSTDGEVVLGGGGHGDWCQPDLTLAQVDLPKNGVANALTAIPATVSSSGYAFAGTGNNASGVAFARVDITDTDPPSASVSATFNSSNSIKTNGVFGEANYAYLATDTNNKEVTILGMTDGSYSEVGQFDAPDNGDSNSVYVSGNVGYMTTHAQNNDYFYTFDLSEKTGSRTQRGSVEIAGVGNKIQVIGNYAYVAVNSSSTPLQIINIQNAASPQIVAQAVNLNDQGGTDIFVNTSQTRAYLVTSSSNSGRELFILDVSNPSGDLPVLASYDTFGMSPKGVTAVTNNKVIMVGTGGTEYQVVTYDDSTQTISSCPNGTGLLNVDTGVNGVAAVIQPSGGAYSYIITGDTTTEFKVILGGPSGQASTNGNFISRVYDAGLSTAFNRMFATTTQPGGTSIQFQAAVADPNPDCAGANFVFQDLGANGALLLDDDGTGYENPGQCFRYKAEFTTSDISNSPTLFDVTVNYSP